MAAMLARPDHRVHRHRAAVVVAVALVLAALAPTEARADWRRSTQLTYNTAFTLDQGGLELGVLSPLSVGITDEAQLSLHPVLLLLGVPSFGLRWRVTRRLPVAVSLDFNGTWQFNRQEDGEGVPAQVSSASQVGYPGTLQLTSTVTFSLGKEWLASVGGGPGVDFLSADPIRGLVELHGSIHWLPQTDVLIMAHVQMYVATDGVQLIRRPVAQLMAAYAVSDLVHVGGGVAFGEFVFETDDTDRRELSVFPVADVWFRF